MIPVAFVSHGAPPLALDLERGAELGRWAGSMPQPSAILVVSAHWEATPAAVGTTRTRDLIYDFGGFPRELYTLQYAAPGAPQVVERVAGLSAAERRDERGWDHGVWVPLLHMFPGADVPVAQLSLPSQQSPRELFELGRRLAPLRAEGVLLLASGGSVHNLSRLDWSGAAPPEDWALGFETWLRERLTEGDTEALLAYERAAPHVDLAHPTREHLQPLFVALGAAAEHPSPLRFPIGGFEYGNLSRTSIQFG